MRELLRWLGFPLKNPLDSIQIGLVTGDDLELLAEAGCFGDDSGTYRVNPTSVDFAIGPHFKIESMPVLNGVRLGMGNPLYMTDKKDFVLLEPGEFCLASTAGKVSLPDDVSALLQLRSSAARAGLEHTNSGWIGAGFTGAGITLELRNGLAHSSIGIEAGQMLIQLMLFKHKKINQAKSRYIDSGEGPQQSKGV